MQGTPNYHLTKTNLFKSDADGISRMKSWSIVNHLIGASINSPDYGIVVAKDNEATNWHKYFKANVQAGLEGTGYIIHRYKRGDGIKKTVVGKTYANYLNANDKKYYGMTGKQFYNFTENDNGYENALFFKTNQKEAA